jgi:hypothetical protein
VLQVTVFAVACYFMMGFQLSAAKFAVWWAVLVLFALASETLGYMAAIATPDSKVGVAVLSILLVFLLSFSGYLVSWRAVLRYIGYNSYNKQQQQLCRFSGYLVRRLGVCLAGWLGWLG